MAQTSESQVTTNTLVGLYVERRFKAEKTLFAKKRAEKTHLKVLDCSYGTVVWSIMQVVISENPVTMVNGTPSKNIVPNIFRNLLSRSEPRTLVLRKNVVHNNRSSLVGLNGQKGKSQRRTAAALI